jgi:catechol 2,3-dioxygenase-like lactoylglutathione lyase family enzyme
MVKRLLLAFAMAGAPGAASAQAVAPWQEAVISVRDLDKSSRFFREVGGWTVRAQGAVHQAELDYWKLPKRAKGKFQLVCAPKTATGCIRFVQLAGLTQRPIRPAVRPWDTGGIYSVMIRSDNVRALFEKALTYGWWAESEPISFSFGGSDLRNVVLMGADGVNIAVYERVAPAFTAFPVGAMSQAFNSMRMVKDHAAALSFYKDKLGLSQLFNADYLDPAPQPSNFSVPMNLTTSIPRRAAVVQPVPGETGRIELMQFVGFTGRDMSAAASLPSLGIISVRYPVTGLSDYRRMIAGRGVEAEFLAEGVAIGGLGTANLLAVRDPDGNITEFYELTRAAKK